jgi:hypothetical protein
MLARCAIVITEFCQNCMSAAGVVEHRACSKKTPIVLIWFVEGGAVRVVLVTIPRGMPPSNA